MPSSQINNGIIYIHTNIITGKSYIGQTIQSFDKRWKKHVYEALNIDSQSIFHKSIKKYGEDAFVGKILEDNIDELDLDTKESYWIDKYNTFKNGYNMTSGGQLQVSKERYKTLTDEQKKKISEGVKKSYTPELKAKMSKAHSGTNSSSFKPWWFITPTGEYIEVDDITMKEFSLSHNQHRQTVSGIAHGKVVEQGYFKGWSFGYDTINEYEYYQNINKPKRKSPTTKGQPRDTSWNNKEIKQYDKITGELIATYPSAKAAAEALGLKRTGTIVRCAQGHRRLGSGYIWKYTKDITEDWEPEIDSKFDKLKNRVYERLVA